MVKEPSPLQVLILEGGTLTVAAWWVDAIMGDAANKFVMVPPGELVCSAEVGTCGECELLGLRLRLTLINEHKTVVSLSSCATAVGTGANTSTQTNVLQILRYHGRHARPIALNSF